MNLQNPHHKDTDQKHARCTSCDVQPHAAPAKYPLTAPLIVARSLHNIQGIKASLRKCCRSMHSSRMSSALGGPITPFIQDVVVFR